MNIFDALREWELKLNSHDNANNERCVAKTATKVIYRDADVQENKRNDLGGKTVE